MLVGLEAVSVFPTEQSANVHLPRHGSASAVTTGGRRAQAGSEARPRTKSIKTVGRIAPPPARIILRESRKSLPMASRWAGLRVPPSMLAERPPAAHGLASD